MSTMSNMSKNSKEARKVTSTNAVTNYMGGVSYEVNPLDTLKMVSASSIFGEPQYYRHGEFAEKAQDGIFMIDRLFRAYSVLDTKKFNDKKTSEVMEMVIDEALDYDFGATLEWARELRKTYNMRLNPQIIMVRAAIHPGRVEFNEKNPGVFSTINNEVMSRADEPASQLTYYLFRKGSKNNVPNILKRSWAKKIESLKPYNMNKYKNSGVGMIDVIRVSHAKGKLVNELMRTGSIEVPEESQTWETMRSAGKSWKEILGTIKLGHMALLRNLRNIFKEIEDADMCHEILDELKAGVTNGKQFPFRYWTAMKQIENCNDVHCRPQILAALEDCMDIACDNMPKLKGKTMCLSDNSGSAWGSFNSEYGSVTVAEIDNLSAIITAKNSDEGYVGKFGDRLQVIPVSQRAGVLATQKDVCSDARGPVGGSTENGIWLFFKEAINKKEHWDNIFIYSDQQAGHGGLYGTVPSQAEYSKMGYGVDSSGRCGFNPKYVDVAKLIDEYRRKVNPNVNVFSVQTAGYNNVVVPEYGYRTNLLYGWTGKELLFADTMIKFWDEKSNQK